MTPHFLLYGILGVYNYGCEAIVRGTVALLREVWPECQIDYASLRPEADEAVLSDLEIRVVPRRPWRRYSCRNVCAKVARTVGSSWLPLMEYSHLARSYDAVLSIGGDLYTIGPRGGYDRHLLRFGEAVKAAQKRYVIWGASIGPFDDAATRAAFKSHLSKADLITSREPSSTVYLASLGLSENVVSCADPAFVLGQPGPRPRNHRLRIGVNFSPFSSLACDAGIAGARRSQADVISALANQMDADILLVPHVCSSKPADDDYGYLSEMRASLPDNVRARTALLNANLGFAKTGSALATCDVVVAARMHCAINALGVGRPTVLIAYSQKAYGMARYVYENERFVLPIAQLDAQSACRLMSEVLRESADLEKFIASRSRRFYKDARGAANSLLQILTRAASD
ncbi:MAG: polysaccharide pyruvyl transferase family protein [Terriglobales bacterium]